MNLADTPATHPYDRRVSAPAADVGHGSMAGILAEANRTAYASVNRTVSGRTAYDPEGGIDRQAGADDVDDHLSPASAASSQLPLSGRPFTTAHGTPLRPLPQGALLATVSFGLPLGAGLNAREHHMARSRRVKRERRATAWALTAGGIPRGLAPCTVTLTRHGRQRLDSDNLSGAFKAVRDEVALWLGVDDGSDVVEWVYRQRYHDQGVVTIDFGGRQ